MAFFLVGAVEAARNATRPLPVDWLPSAFDRFKVVFDQGEPSVELYCLARALSIWLRLWGDHKRSAWFGQLADSIRSAGVDIDARWPGKKWIPRKPPDPGKKGRNG